jgi:cardiolipin synthase (CMP-forming)
MIMRVLTLFHIPYVIVQRTYQVWHTIPINQRRFTIPTLVTIIRIIITPAIVIARLYNSWIVAFILFILAALTDFFDGWLARIRNEQTMLGTCLDPIADKILIISCFAAFSFSSHELLAIPSWLV